MKNPLEVRTCNGKMMYDKKGAITAKNKRFHDDHTPLRVYECPNTRHRHWHLTSQNPYKNENKKSKKAKKPMRYVR